MPKLINENILKPYLEKYNPDGLEDKHNIICRWRRNLQQQRGDKEESIKGPFFEGVFENVLGYINPMNSENGWTIQYEERVQVDRDKADGAIGYFSRDRTGDIQGVVEVKGPMMGLDEKERKKDRYETPVEQAFRYASKIDRCMWIVVTNMKEFRIYKTDRGMAYYNYFFLDNLNSREEFLKFHFIFNSENLLDPEYDSIIKELCRETIERNFSISNSFYDLYDRIRRGLLEHFIGNGNSYSEEVLLEKAQKFLDRIIFIRFCEDRRLLPKRLLKEAIIRGKDSLSMSDITIWDEVRGLFRAVDQGRQTPKYKINGYNGGLFRHDEVLDELEIKNDFFEEVERITGYDFNSDVDVNILGHIFEQSIYDIEAMKAEIRDEEFDPARSRRKADGIYYTPEAITQYMVEASVGRYLKRIKDELGENQLPDIESAKSKRSRTAKLKEHKEFYAEYEDRLRAIRILDPACGSGAFLNKAFDYLLKEYQDLYKNQAELKRLEEDGGGEQIGLLEASEAYQKEILQDNLYGVDINQESVEITKLALWLKTADPKRELAYLDDNIKCGNSLSKNKKVVGERAFDWDEEFSEVMEQGGFDIVIGNPPYGIVYDEEVKREYWDNFYSFERNFDIYVAFYHRAFQLVKNGGIVSYITPNTFLNGDYYKKLRSYITHNSRIHEVVDFKNVEVFDDPTVFVAVMTAEKQGHVNFPYSFRLRIPGNIVGLEQDEYIEDQVELSEAGERELKPVDPILERVKKMDGVCEIGEKFYVKDVGFNYWTRGGSQGESIGKRVFYRGRQVDERDIPFLKGANISRYHIKKPNNYLRHDYNEYIDEEVDTFRYSPEFVKMNPKLVYRQTSDKIIADVDEDGNYLDKTVHLIVPREGISEISLYYVLALLNSRLYNYFYRHISQEKEGRTFSQVKTVYIKQLPLKMIPEEKQERFDSRVRRLRNNYRRLEEIEIMSFWDVAHRYVSGQGVRLKNICEDSKFFNPIYSGRAKIVRPLSVGVNGNIVTVYSDKGGNGKYELFKVEIKDKVLRQYVMLYLKSMGEDELEAVNDFEGGLLERVGEIVIPDYDKRNVVRHVIDEWDRVVNEKEELKQENRRLDLELEELVYRLYNIPEEEQTEIEKIL